MLKYPSSSHNTCLLEQIRHQGEISELKRTFLRSLREDPLKALELLSNRSISFTTLFYLQEEIMNSPIRPLLMTNHNHALRLLSSFLENDRVMTRKILAQSSKTLSYRTLKWMFETGCQDDGISKEFEEVMDTAALLLSKEYKDRSILPVLAELIFNRHRRGGFIYDLAWAFFEAADPRGLYIIASRLCSTYWDDVELARKLLHFIPCINSCLSMEPEYQYQLAINWINSNYPFMRYTGESFQQTFNPEPYTVALDEKYLCKVVLTSDKQRTLQPSKHEALLLDQFHSLDKKDQVLLSDYSYYLYTRNKPDWNSWINSPVKEQIAAAKRDMGGLL